MCGVVCVRVMLHCVRSWTEITSMSQGTRTPKTPSDVTVNHSVPTPRSCHWATLWFSTWHVKNYHSFCLWVNRLLLRVCCTRNKGIVDLLKLRILKYPKGDILFTKISVLFLRNIITLNWRNTEVKRTNTFDILYYFRFIILKLCKNMSCMKNSIFFKKIN